MMGGKNVGVIAGGLFLAAMFYLSSSGLVTVAGIQKMADENKQYLQNEAGAKGMTLFVLLDIALIVACQPGSFFMELLAGYIYGVYVGVGLILAAKLTAAGICFALGKFMFADWVNSMLQQNQTFKTLKSKSGTSGFMLVLGLRLSPVPSYLCSYCSSVMNVPFGAYMQATAACTAPMVINNVYMGQAAGDFKALLSGKSGGSGIADYVKISLPLVGTLVLCDWIRRFLASLTSETEPHVKKSAPAKPAPGQGSELEGGGGRRRSRSRARPTTVAPAPSQSSKTPSKEAAGKRGKSPSPSRARSRTRLKSPARK